MTKNSNLKKTIRARQADTGETYTEARRHLAGGRSPWLRVGPTDASALAGARRRAAAGVPVIIIDDGNVQDDSVLIAAKQFAPSIVDLNDLSLHLDPFTVLHDAQRKARAAASLLRTVLPDATPEDLEDALLTAAERGERSLSKALESHDRLFEQAHQLAVASSMFSRLVQSGGSVEVKADAPVVVRGSLWDGLQPFQPAADQTITSRIAAAALHLVKELGAEALNSDSDEAVVYFRGWWHTFDGQQGVMHPVALDFDLPTDAAMPKSGDGFATSASGEVSWTPGARQHVVIAGTGSSGKSSTVDSLVSRALSSGSEVHMYRVGGDVPAGVTSSAETLQQFVRNLVSVATKRLVQGIFDKHAVIVVDDLADLLEKKDVPPTPSYGLPRHLVDALNALVADAEQQNLEVDSAGTLLDQFVRRSAELRTTVIFASTQMPHWERFGGKAAWSDVTLVHLGRTGHRFESGLPGWLATTNRADSPGRAAITGPGFDGTRVAQVYTARR